MRRIIFLVVFALAPVFAHRAAGQEIMPVSELEPGMIATAKTIFQGDTIEDFQVKIIDVLRNFYPKRDLIIVRLLGAKPEFTGPVAGMSGSPVYYDGKLIGALSYSLGNFLKEPLMGVTPISEMLEIAEKEKQRDTEVATAGSVENMRKYLQVALGLESPDWAAFAITAPARGASAAPALRQLPIPLQMGGFTDHSFALAQELLASMGFAPVRGGSASSSDDGGGDLVPGAAVAAVLLSGDMDIAATGTVTYRAQNRVLAFGHPFFDNGPIALPMARARILTTISSEYASQKLGQTGKIVGTLLQDRTTGVMGEIGPVPAMTPVKMTYTAETGESRQFSFSLAQEKSLAFISPLILRIALVSALESARLSTGQSSLVLKGRVQLDDGTELSLDNLFAGFQPLPGFSFLNSILHSTGQIAATLAAIASNPYRYVRFTQIDLDFTSISGRQTAELENIWVNQTTFQPGDTIQVNYRLRPYLGEPYFGTSQVIIPASVRGTMLSVVVGGGSALNTLEKRLMPAKFDPSSYDNLIKIIQNDRRNDRLVIQLRLIDRGVVVDGDELPGLPPSIYPIVASKNSKNNTVPTRDRVVFETEILQTRTIAGLRIIRLTRK